MASPNLTVVSVTDNSVTLGWAPESLAVGPTTFTVAIGHPWHDPKGSGGGINYQAVGSTTSTNFTIYNLKPSTSYILGVAPKAPGGTNGYTDIGATTRAAPTPTNLRFTGLTSTTISLAWNAPVGPVPVVSYQILGVFDGVFVQYPLSFVNIYGTNVTLTGLTPGRSLLWGVSAYDANGNLSGYDYLPSLVINPVPTPAVLSAVAMPTTGGGFSFTVQAGAVRSTLIPATTNPGDHSSWVTIATNPPSGATFSFTDTNASQFTVRFYREVSP